MRAPALELGVPVGMQDWAESFPCNRTFPLVLEMRDIPLLSSHL